MSKTAIVLIATLAALAVIFSSQENNKTDAFQEWKAQYGVNWAPSEDSYRRVIFMKNLEAIQKHNSNPYSTYKTGVNQFTVYSQEEFVSLYLGAIPPVDQEVSMTENYEVPNADVDWTQHGGVSPIKNQGQCGSCWAFSATGVAESWSYLRGRKVDLSEQQLVDCSKPANHGCNGGWPARALDYVKANGIASQEEYPYTAKDGTCKQQGGSFKIDGYASLIGCATLSSSIFLRPISVTVDATNWSTYKEGVFSGCGNQINHAVLLVGVVGGAWKIKNSWSTSWGESGFIRLASGNTCGVCSYAGIAVN